MTPLLEGEGLALPGRLQPTSLTVPAPGLTCLIGPNGSGKTSLLHAISGIGSPSGNVRINGRSATGLAPAERMRLFSYLPASREVAWPVAARDLIALGLPDDSEERIDEAMDQLDLSGFAERRVDRLSTGERSRVLIARALAARPRLLLLDEPIANLDPYWQLKLMDILAAAPARGQAVLLALHDLDLAADYADRLILMDDGRIAADGKPAEIIGGSHIPAVFGVERSGGRWRPLTPSADPRSLP
jgi:iron complex transport system ATP-binding protein